MRTGRALVLIVVVVVIAVLLLRHTNGPNPRATSTTTTHHSSSTTALLPTTTTTVALIPPSSIKLQVLNGVLTGSISSEFNTKLHTSPGYQTLLAENATTTTPLATSTIYVLTPGYVPEADALAQLEKLPLTDVNTTIPPPTSAPISSTDRTEGANLILVVGQDLAPSA